MTVVPIAYDAQLFINGEFTDAASGKTLDIVNPATGAVIGRLADAGAMDVDRAVTAAQNAFDEGKWSGASIQERARILNRFADLFEADLEAFYKLETLNNGRPIVETRAQISRLPQFYRYFAALALTRRSDVIPIEGPYLCYTQRVPLGVVALMTSFQPSVDDPLEKPRSGPRDRKQRGHQTIGADATHHDTPGRASGSRRNTRKASSTW